MPAHSIATNGVNSSSLFETLRMLVGDGSVSRNQLLPQQVRTDHRSRLLHEQRPCLSLSIFNPTNPSPRANGETLRRQSRERVTIHRLVRVSTMLCCSTVRTGNAK